MVDCHVGWHCLGHPAITANFSANDSTGLLERTAEYYSKRSWICISVDVRPVLTGFLLSLSVRKLRQCLDIGHDLLLHWISRSVSYSSGFGFESRPGYLQECFGFFIGFLWPYRQRLFPSVFFTLWRSSHSTTSYSYKWTCRVWGNEVWGSECAGFKWLRIGPAACI